MKALKRRRVSRMPETEKERLACPICCEFFLATVTCPSGHVICDVCYQKLDPRPARRCPLCRSVYRKAAVPSAELEQLMRRAMVDCRFKSEGCKEVIPLTEKRQHENTCSFNQAIRCPFMKLDEDDDFFDDLLEPCDAEVTTKSILHHLTTDHLVEVIAIKRTARLILDERVIYSEPILKLDRVFSSPDVSFHVMLANTNDTFDFVVSVLDHKIQQRIVSLELRKGLDRCLMVKPTYGVRGKTHPCCVFQFSDQELNAYVENGRLEVSITVVARDAN